MKITKFVHACLLVEMPEPVNRTALFDPGAMSAEALDISTLVYLDDIIFTHEHQDHYHLPLLRSLLEKFPDARVTAPQSLIEQLEIEGIAATSMPSEGIAFFQSPHEHTEPLFPTPDQKGIHYLDLLSNPGDSHSFSETKPVLALPVTAPWGSTIKAVNLAIELKPRYVLPVHDWHWSDPARAQMYDRIASALAEHNITFIKLETGKPVVLDV